MGKKKPDLKVYKQTTLASISIVSLAAAVPLSQSGDYVSAGFALFLGLALLLAKYTYKL